MTEPLNQNRSAEARPVLIWQAEGEESLVKSDLAEAGEFLHVSHETVEAAIASGEPLEGWFVDWEASGA